MEPAQSEKSVISIKQAAALTGLTEDTLRYYERIGLFRPVQRNGIARRCYTSEDIQVIQLLTRLKATGMSIEQMKQFMRLVYEGERTVLERRQLLDVQRQELEARIGQLRETLDFVHYKMNLYEQIAAKSQENQTKEEV